MPGLATSKHSVRGPARRSKQAAGTQLDPGSNAANAQALEEDAAGGTSMLDAAAAELGEAGDDEATTMERLARSAHTANQTIEDIYHRGEGRVIRKAAHYMINAVDRMKDHPRETVIHSLSFGWDELHALRKKASAMDAELDKSYRRNREGGPYAAQRFLTTVEDLWPVKEECYEALTEICSGVTQVGSISLAIAKVVKAVGFAALDLALQRCAPGASDFIVAGIDELATQAGEVLAGERDAVDLGQLTKATLVNGALGVGVGGGMKALGTAAKRSGLHQRAKRIIDWEAVSGHVAKRFSTLYGSEAARGLTREAVRELLEKVPEKTLGALIGLVVPGVERDGGMVEEGFELTPAQQQAVAELLVEQREALETAVTLKDPSYHADWMAPAVLESLQGRYSVWFIDAVTIERSGYSLADVSPRKAREYAGAVLDTVQANEIRPMLVDFLKAHGGAPCLDLEDAIEDAAKWVAEHWELDEEWD